MKHNQCHDLTCNASRNSPRHGEGCSCKRYVQLLEGKVEIYEKLLGVMSGTIVLDNWIINVIPSKGCTVHNATTGKFLETSKGTDSRFYDNLAEAYMAVLERIN